MRRARTLRVVAIGVAVGSAVATFVVPGLARAADVPLVNGPVVTEQDHQCGPEDLPETGIQGDVPKADQDSGRAELGYNCGLALVGHTTLGGFDRPPTGNANMAWAGDCAYVAGAGAVFGDPTQYPEQFAPYAGDYGFPYPDRNGGVAVVDVSDPEHPAHVATLRTPGSLYAMETLHAVETPERSILVVGQYGNQAGGNKPMDVYDVSDCANPVLLQTFIWPSNIHNLTISANGRYVFATQPLQVADLAPLFDGDPATGTVYLGNLDEVTPAPPFAVGPTADLDDALPPALRDASRGFYLSHEAWPSADGTRLYVGGQLPIFETFSILDLTAWLTRDAANTPAGPPVVLSQRSGRGHSVRTATIRGQGRGRLRQPDRQLVLHSEESVFGPTYGCVPEDLNPFAGPAQPWLTDVTDPANPVRVSQFGLEINDPANCAAMVDSDISASVHYHDVDDPDDTTFVMASMWNSGIRVFDVRDPERPTEVAYFNPGDVEPGAGTTLDHAWGHIRYVERTGQLWFATADGGFWVVELERQLQRHLGIGATRGRHPDGRPGTEGVQLLPGVQLSADGWQYSCTIAAAATVLAPVAATGVLGDTPPVVTDLVPG